MKTWTDLFGTSTEAVLEWAAEQPWAQAMKTCGQDSKWHAEGDVWTHTRMVCRELERLPEWTSLERSRQLGLLLAGLLHDAGKPVTAKVDPDTGRVRSSDHALVGAQLARKTLRELACPLAIREAIANLVRFHSRPAHLLKKPDPEREVIRLSWLVNNRDLHLLSLGDTRGRVTRDEKKPEDQLELWQMLAKEQRCYDNPYPFKNDHARFLFYRDSLSSLSASPPEAFRCTVTLMSGLPGAGKDTWLSQNRPGLPVVAIDAQQEELDVEPTDTGGRVLQAAREKVREHLRAGTGFAFNATNLTREIRHHWIGLFAACNARVDIVYLEPRLELIYQRNRQRSHPLPETMIRRLVDRLEPPTLAEAHGLERVESPAC